MQFLSQIDPEARPAALAPPFTGHFRVILDTPRGLQSLHPGTRPSQHPNAAVNGIKTQPSATPASLELRSNIYQTTSKASRPITETEASTLANGATSGAVNGSAGRSIATVTYKCDTCGSDCTTVRYHSLKVKDFELCQSCYLDGRFPSTMFSGDFVKLSNVGSGNAHGSGNGDGWTDQEVLLLLEAVEMYDDDWFAIEAHVGTRSAQQCIRKFLELPIEDPYLTSEGEMGALRYARVPFEQADNPVMSVVAFLAGVVGPGVAAEAAKTALHDLAAGGDETKPASEGKHTESEKKDDAPKDSMDEDPTEKLSGPSDAPLNTAAPAADDMSVDGPSTKPPPGVPHSKVVRAAKLALSSSAKAASTLADAEETQIRSTLAAVIKLTLTKLELKMSQFEELEDILEEERRTLEAARMALVSERIGLKRTLEGVRAELTRHSNGTSTAGAVAAVVTQSGLGTTGQGLRATEVHGSAIAESEGGPLGGGNIAALS
jgi:SWI/SNF related-matrix-associated actin-dependent regulator of chromatin subfamily C